MKRDLVGIVVGAAILSACTYNAAVESRPSYSLVTNYEDKIGGTWLLYVDATQLSRPMKPSGVACAAHKFPIDAAAPFESSVRQTLANVFESVEEVASPVTGAQIKNRGAKGLIVVRGEEVRAKLDVKPGFWMANMEGQSTVVASIAINGTKGRVFGTTVEGTGITEAEAGAMCGGGANALGQSVSQAIGDTMRKMGEAASNSERVRAL